MKRMNLSLSSIKPVWFLIFGIISIALTHTTFSVDFIAWFASVPFLIYLSLTNGWKTRVFFILSLIAAWSFAVLKIITPPIPFIMIFLFSVPITLFHLPAYLIWDRFKNHKWSILLFPAIMIVMEWLQYTFTPFASWGVMAYSQSHSLTIMQFVSVFGIAGLSFLIYWINASITQILIARRITLMSFYLPVSILLGVIIFCSLRFDIGKSKSHETITVATVGTSSEVNGLPLPTKESNDKAIHELLRKTEKAGEYGAKLIVWNEASFYAMPKEEMNLLDSIKTVAKEKNTAIVAAYVIPISEKPLKYENKFVLINKNGEIEYSYLKHQPVPGEPAIKGTNPLKMVQISESRVGGAICYDYDFPYIARENGNLMADIVAVPSSDWRGIDPLHTKMAAFRAIEQGHTVIRSTRFGLSAIISPYGELISQSSSFNKNDKIMIGSARLKGFSTIYSIIGDLFIYLCIGFIIVFAIKLIASPLRT